MKKMLLIILLLLGSRLFGQETSAYLHQLPASATIDSSWIMWFESAVADYKVTFYTLQSQLRTKYLDNVYVKKSSLVDQYLYGAFYFENKVYMSYLEVDTLVSAPNLRADSIKVDLDSDTNAQFYIPFTANYAGYSFLKTNGELKYNPYDEKLLIAALNISGLTASNVVMTDASKNLSSSATGNLTENITGLEFNATRSLIGGAAQLSLTTGYFIPSTTEQTNWNAAYNDKINSASFNTSNGVITLTQQDAGTVTVDIDGRFGDVFLGSANIFTSTNAFKAGSTYIRDAGGDDGILDGSFTLDRTFTFPDKDGTVAMTSDLIDANITFSDVTTGNASASKHGFLPKLENTGTKFLRDDGTWQTAGSGDVTASGNNTFSGINTFSNEITFSGTWIRTPEARTLNSWGSDYQLSGVEGENFIELNEGGNRTLVNIDDETTDGTIITIMNLSGSYTVTINETDNIIVPGSSIVLSQRDSATFRYQSSGSFWVCIGYTDN